LKVPRPRSSQRIRSERRGSLAGSCDPSATSDSLLSTSEDSNAALETQQPRGSQPCQSVCVIDTSTSRRQSFQAQTADSHSFSHSLSVSEGPASRVGSSTAGAAVEFRCLCHLFPRVCPRPVSGLGRATSLNWARVVVVNAAAPAVFAACAFSSASSFRFASMASSIVRGRPGTSSLHSCPKRTCDSISALMRSVKNAIAFSSSSCVFLPAPAAAGLLVAMMKAKWTGCTLQGAHSG